MNENRELTGKQIQLGQLETEPFKYTIVENCLDLNLYQELYQTFPYIRPSVLSNRPTVKGSSELKGLWKEFADYHTSRDFFLKVAELFDIKERGQVGLRNSQRPIEMECQCIINSPVMIPSSVKLPHRDNPETRWAGILYFCDPDDFAGGDLLFYDCDPHFYKKRYTDNHGEPFKVIKYEPNKFVSWENSLNAIHGVTVRQKTSRLRKYVNFTIDIR